MKPKTPTWNPLKIAVLNGITFTLHFLRDDHPHTDHTPTSKYITLCKVVASVGDLELGTDYLGSCEYDSLKEAKGDWTKTITDPTELTKLNGSVSGYCLSMMSEILLGENFSELPFCSESMESLINEIKRAERSHTA